MAFNFNWSPLTADEKFYEKARDLLTTALNKSPKPPIIVDDILVTEFNLGSVPPELEILEIGDIAEDRFRGIFKMCYSGDAFLTLKTRVQVCGFHFVPGSCILCSTCDHHCAYFLRTPRRNTGEAPRSICVDGKCHIPQGAAVQQIVLPCPVTRSDPTDEELDRDKH
jgi:hypothetical protein